MQPEQQLVIPMPGYHQPCSNQDKPAQQPAVPANRAKYIQHHGKRLENVAPIYMRTQPDSTSNAGAALRPRSYSTWLA
jgi:hypothetical protein